MATPEELLDQSLAKFRTAKRVSGQSASYKKDNPTEYAKVIAYLDGGARPSGVTTDMGLALLLEEDARRALGVVEPPPPPSPPSSIPPVESGWTRVLTTDFGGSFPTTWGRYNGAVASSAYSWWDPNQVVMTPDSVILRHSYKASGTAAGAGKAGFDNATGAGWYQGSIYILNPAGAWGAVNARVTARLRVTSYEGVVSHRNLPLRWGYPSQEPVVSGVRGTSGDGEEDWMEDDGPNTAHSCFIHWYTNGSTRAGGVGTISDAWSSVDNRDWHIYKFQRVGQTVMGWVDGVLAMQITGTEYQLPPTARRWIVFQQENKHASPMAGPGTGREDIEIDWITVDNVA